MKDEWLEPHDWCYETEGFYSPKSARKKQNTNIDKAIEAIDLEALLILSEDKSNFKGGKFKLRQKRKNVYVKRSHR